MTKRRLFAAVIIILGGSLAYFIHVINSPAEGIIKVSTVESPIVQTGSQNYQNLSTPYFTLLYPGEYPLKPGSANSPNILSYQASGHLQNQTNTGTLVIELRRTPAGGITTDYEYKAFQSQPKVYKWSQKFYGAEIVDIATRQAGGEENALWLHGNYLLSVRLNAGLTAKALDQVVKDIISSVQWN